MVVIAGDASAMRLSPRDAGEESTTQQDEKRVVCKYGGQFCAREKAIHHLETTFGKRRTWLPGEMGPSIPPKSPGGSGLPKAPENRHTHLFLFEGKSTVMGWGAAGQPPGAWACSGHNIKSHLRAPSVWAPCPGAVVGRAGWALSARHTSHITLMNLPRHCSHPPKQEDTECACGGGEVTLQARKVPACGLLGKWHLGANEVQGWG